MIFMGTPDFAVPTLEKLIRAGHEMAAVVTQPDRRQGRGKKLKPGPVKEYAARQGVKVLQPERLDEAFTAQVERLAPEVIVVVAYGKLLPGSILALPPLGCLNVHASLLPKYRGAAPIHRAVINGETISGVTIMKLDQGMDTGPIFSQSEVSLTAAMTAGQLHDRLALIGAELLASTLVKITRGLEPVPQDDSLASYAPPLTKADERLDWQDSAAGIVNRVRGMNPWPGTYTIDGNQRLKIYAAQIFPYSTAGAAPGTVVEVTDRGFVVAAGDGSVLVTEVQPPGKARMAAADFLRGHPMTAGRILGREVEQPHV